VIVHVNLVADKDLLTALNAHLNIIIIFKGLKLVVYKFVIQINTLIVVLNHVLLVIRLVKHVLDQRKQIVVYAHKISLKNKMVHVF